MLVKNRFKVLARLGYGVVWPVERKTVGEHQTNVSNELVGAVITRIIGIRVGFLRVGRHELALDGSEIHWTLDDTRVVGDVEGDWVNGMDECRGVFHFFQRTDGRKTEPMLLNTERGWAPRSWWYRGRTGSSLFVHLDRRAGGGGRGGSLEEIAVAGTRN